MWVGLGHRPRHEPDALMLAANRLEPPQRVLGIHRPLRRQPDQWQRATVVVAKDLNLVLRHQHDGVCWPRLLLDPRHQAAVVVPLQTRIEVLRR